MRIQNSKFKIQNDTTERYIEYLSVVVFENYGSKMKGERRKEKGERREFKEFREFREISENHLGSLSNN